MNRWRLFDRWPDAAKNIVFKALTELHEKYAAADAYDDRDCIDAETLLEVLHYRVRHPVGRQGTDDRVQTSVEDGVHPAGEVRG